MISYFLAIALGITGLVLDQYTKHLVASQFILGETRPFIKGFIDLTYIHNTGGAWGMLKDKTWVLMGLTVVVMLICFALLLKLGIKNKLMFWGITLVIFGGIGNLIDRVFKGGNVVDFLHFEFFPTFPVFNVADCCIVLGSGLLVLYFIIDTVKDFKSRSSAVNEPFDRSEDILEEMPESNENE